MKDMDRALWTELFQDKPIPSTELRHFQINLMAEILAHPADFKGESRIAERRKWGIGLAISLMVVGLAFGSILWLERNVVFQWVNVLLVMLSGFDHVLSDLQLLWGVVSWPILGALSIFVLFMGDNQVPNEGPSI